MRFLLFIITCLGVVLMAESCKDCNDPCNQDCKNYYPENNQPKISSEFNVYEYPYLVRTDSLKLYETDTICTRSIKLEAEQESAVYSWEINGKQESTDKSFYYSLPTNFKLNSLEVKLSVKRADEVRCYRNNDTANSFRNIIIKKPNESKCMGCYQGSFTNNPTDSFTVCVYWKQNYSSSLDYYITGLTRNAECKDYTILINSREVLYKKLYIMQYNVNKCFQPEGLLSFDDEYCRKVRIDFRHYKSLNEKNIFLYKTFLGTRIN